MIKVIPSAIFCSRPKVLGKLYHAQAVNVVHASLDSGSHTKVHRRMEDLVHAQMRLENANYGKILKTFYVARCNARHLFISHARVGQLSLLVQDLSLLVLLVLCSNIDQLQKQIFMNFLTKILAMARGFMVMVTIWFAKDLANGVESSLAKILCKCKIQSIDRVHLFMVLSLSRIELFARVCKQLAKR